MKTRALLGFVILLAVPLKAQDRQFWDQAVGGRTALLGGIAVAGVRDYIATFYNPGALGFVSKSSMNVNFNMYGIKDFTAVINPPHGSILAVGAGVKKPVVLTDGTIGVATVMSMTLSVDHRVIDGALGAEFLKAVIEALENPMVMLA
mgnify:CR=1 FL=1